MSPPKQPTLPAPTIADGWTLFTTGDMRTHAANYGHSCFEAGMKCRLSAPVSGKPENDDVINDLLSKMGMKP